MKLNFYKFGKQGPPIVFLHGWQGNAKNFLKLVPYFYKQYQMFLLDLPGFGQSPDLNKDASSFDYAKTITNWIKTNKLKNIILVGHSFGGKISAIIAHQHPKLVSKLILLSNAGIPHTNNKIKLAKKYLPKKILKMLSPLATHLWASRDYKQAGKLLPIFKNIVKEDLKPIFKKIKTPTLIIWGKNDQEVSLADGKLIHKLIKNSKFEIVMGTHFFFNQKTKKTAKSIKTFTK